GRAAKWNSLWVPEKLRATMDELAATRQPLPPKSSAPTFEPKLLLRHGESYVFGRCRSRRGVRGDRGIAGRSVPALRQGSAPWARPSRGRRQQRTCYRPRTRGFM